jgi:hypothetical protein
MSKQKRVCFKTDHTEEYVTLDFVEFNSNEYDKKHCVVEDADTGKGRICWPNAGKLMAMDGSGLEFDHGTLHAVIPREIIVWKVKDVVITELLKGA